jgi:multicomponent Na+:H+ antiporter subunit C
MNYFPYCVAAWLFIVGLYGIITSRHLVHLIVCLSVVQSSTYLLLLAIGFRHLPAQAPIFNDIPPGTPAVDPIVHALTLTDIVVSATVTALLLAMAVDVRRRRDSIDPNKLSPFRG